MMMRADSELLFTAVNNLVSNAIKYTPDNGKINVTANTDAANSKVRLSVKDTGIGISAAEHESIFEKFNSGTKHENHSTSKTAFKGGGLGLGLAIVKGIVEAHGGKIWVESPGLDEEKCPGSEFIIELPLVSVSTRKH
jgi:signal transduction histidine kinase